MIVTSLEAPTCVATASGAPPTISICEKLIVRSAPSAAISL